jgi:hypothetical protein
MINKKGIGTDLVATGHGTVEGSIPNVTNTDGLTRNGTRIVQADSGSDSDSESRRQSAQRMSFYLTVLVRIVVAGAGGAVQTV